MAKQLRALGQWIVGVWESRAMAGAGGAIGALIALWAILRVPSPGISIGILGAAAALMTLRPVPIPKWEKFYWMFLVCVLAVAEIHSIVYFDEQSQNERVSQNTKFQKIADGIKTESDKSDQILGFLQSASRTSVPSPSAPTPLSKDDLIKLWGIASELQSPRVQGARPTVKKPPEIQHGRRVISAEMLGQVLAGDRPAAATIINDGTVEAGAFAKQLEIALRMGGWQAGGDNVKMGDPEFFPDSLTIEVSAVKASPDDNSGDEAKRLAAALLADHIQANVRDTDLLFPPNFMRIKVAGQ